MTVWFSLLLAIPSVRRPENHRLLAAGPVV